MKGNPSTRIGSYPPRTVLRQQYEAMPDNMREAVDRLVASYQSNSDFDNKTIFAEAIDVVLCAVRCDGSCHAKIPVAERLADLGKITLEEESLIKSGMGDMEG